MSTSSLNAPIITEEYARQELESLTIDERHQLHQDLYGCPRSSCCYNSGGTGGSNGGCSCSANNVSVTSSVSNSQATVLTTSDGVVSQKKQQLLVVAKAVVEDVLSATTSATDEETKSVVPQHEGADSVLPSPTSDDDENDHNTDMPPPARMMTSTSSMSSVSEEEEEEDEDSAAGEGSASADVADGGGGGYFHGWSTKLPTSIITTTTSAVTSAMKNEDDLVKAVRDAIETHYTEREKCHYVQAQSTCPQVVDKESNPLYFLRCENYDIQAASKRLIDYWKLRVKVFGKHLAYKSFDEMENEACTADINEECKEEAAAQGTQQNGGFMSSMNRTGYLIRLPQDEHGRATHGFSSGPPLPSPSAPSQT